MVLFSQETEKVIVSLCGLPIPHKYSFSHSVPESVLSLSCVWSHQLQISPCESPGRTLWIAHNLRSTGQPIVQVVLASV